MTFFQAVLTAVFVLLAGVGLFIVATNRSSGGSGIGAVTIWGPFPKNSMNQAIETLANTNKDLKSVTYVQVQASDLEQQYIQAAAQGSPPDLLIISQEDLQPLKLTLAEIPTSAITPRQFADTFADGASIFEDQGGTYGIPFAIDPLVLYYNKTMLASAGIAAPPTTWEALTGLVKQVTATGANASIGNALIALGTYGNVHDARGILSALFFQAGVPISMSTPSGMHGALTTSAGTSGVTPGEAALRFYTSFANPSQQSYTWNSSLPDSQQYFTAGKLALYIGYASELSYLQQANPNLSFDVAKMPQPATASSFSDYGTIYAFAIPKGSKNASGAFATAVALASQASGAAMVPAAGTLAPAERVLLSQQTTDPYQAIFNNQALIVKGWLSPAPATTDTVFGGMIQNVISGQSTPDAALAAAEQALTAALQHP